MKYLVERYKREVGDGFVPVETWEDNDPLYSPWDGDQLPFSQVNNGWGICNTGSGYNVICMKGGIGCNVDHVYVKIRNLEKQLVDLVKTVDTLA